MNRSSSQPLGGCKCWQGCVLPGVWGRARILLFQPSERPASLGSWPLRPSSKPDVSPELLTRPLPPVSTSVLTSPSWALIHVPPRQEGPVATLGNPDSRPTSRPSMHSHQPSAHGHTRFHAHGWGRPACGAPGTFLRPPHLHAAHRLTCAQLPALRPGPWELSCSANVSQGLASAVLAAPPPSSPPGTHSIFLSEFRSRAQTLSIASCSEPLEGSPRRARTRRPKPIPEDLRAQCRQRCAGLAGRWSSPPELAAPG